MEDEDEDGDADVDGDTSFDTLIRSKTRRNRVQSADRQDVSAGVSGSDASDSEDSSASGKSLLAQFLGRKTIGEEMDELDREADLNEQRGPVKPPSTRTRLQPQSRAGKAISSPLTSLHTTSDSAAKLSSPPARRVEKKKRRVIAESEDEADRSDASAAKDPTNEDSGFFEAELIQRDSPSDDEDDLPTTEKSIATTVEAAKREKLAALAAKKRAEQAASRSDEDEGDEERPKTKSNKRGHRKTLASSDSDAELSELAGGRQKKEKGKKVKVSDYTSVFGNRK